jgi:lipopolysaccharide export system permease protein
MRKATLYKYIFHEIWPSFVASLVLLVFVVLAAQMLSITELIVSRGVKISHVARMMSYLIPEMILFALPASSLIAVTVAFLRLSADNEVTAIKACGVSVYQLVPPVAVLSAGAFCIALFVGLYGVSWGNRSFKNLLFEIAQSRADLGVKERVFSEPFEGVMFYINEISEQENLLKNVFVMDRRDKKVTNTIMAQEAMILSRPDRQMISLRFTNGTIFVVDKDLESSRTIEFKTYDLNVDLADILAGLTERQEKPKEMSIGALIHNLMEQKNKGPDYNKMMIELLERTTLPIAVFLMGIIGVPLGTQLRGGGRSAGVGASLVVFLIYYLCLAGAKSMSEGGAVPPGLGMWIPNAFLGFICIILFWAARRERSIMVLPLSVVKRIRFDRRLAL